MSEPANIYAMGDIVGGLQFTYISLDDFRIVRSAVLGDGSSVIPALSQAGKKANGRITKSVSRAAKKQSNCLKRSRQSQKTAMDVKIAANEVRGHPDVEMAFYRQIKSNFLDLIESEETIMQALQAGWDFFQNEVLGMKWLNRLIGSAVEACGLDPASKVGGSIRQRPKFCVKSKLQRKTGRKYMVWQGGSLRLPCQQYKRKAERMSRAAARGRRAFTLDVRAGFCYSGILSPKKTTSWA